MDPQLDLMKTVFLSAIQAMDPRDPGDRAARLILARASFLLPKPIEHRILCEDLRDYTDPEKGFLGELRPELVGEPLDAAPFFEAEAVQAGLNRLRQLNLLELVVDLPDHSTPNQFLRSCKPAFDPEMNGREGRAIILNILSQAEIAYEREEISLLDGLVPHLGLLAESYKASRQDFSPFLCLYYGWAVSFYGKYEVALDFLNLATKVGQEIMEQSNLFPYFAYGQYLMTLGRSGHWGEANAKMIPFLDSFPPGPISKYEWAPAFARVLRNAGTIARVVNDLERAEQYLRKALEGLQHVYGPYHKRTGLCEASLVLVLAERSNPVAAEPHLQAVLQTISAHRNESSSATMGLQVGESLVVLKRYAEAEKVLGEALDSVHAHFGPESSYIEQIEDLLGVVAEATRPKVEEAAPKAGWFQKLGWFQKS